MFCQIIEPSPVFPSQIEDKLSEEMLEGKLNAGKSYECRVVEGEIAFVETSPMGHGIPCPKD